MTIDEIIKAGEDFCKMIFDFSLQPRFRKSDAFFLNSLGADVSSIVNRIASVDAEYEVKSDPLFSSFQIEKLNNIFADFSSSKDLAKYFVYCHPDPERYSFVDIYERTDSGDLLVWSGHEDSWPEDEFPFHQTYHVEEKDIIPYKGVQTK